MMVSHDDEIEGACSDVAWKAFELAPLPKELIEIDGGHFGLLHYPSNTFDMASSAQIDFLKRHLLWKIGLDHFVRKTRWICFSKLLSGMGSEVEAADNGRVYTRLTLFPADRLSLIFICFG